MIYYRYKSLKLLLKLLYIKLVIKIKSILIKIKIVLNLKFLLKKLYKRLLYLIIAFNFLDFINIFIIKSLILKYSKSWILYIKLKFINIKQVNYTYCKKN